MAAKDMRSLVQDHTVVNDDGGIELKSFSVLCNGAKIGREQDGQSGPRVDLACCTRKC